DSADDRSGGILLGAGKQPDRRMDVTPSNVTTRLHNAHISFSVYLPISCTWSSLYILLQKKSLPTAY
ncbi:hypothetical protein ASPFODRAFT_54518, partial [Aspergillus luchuensis CBS 106.47]